MLNEKLEIDMKKNLIQDEASSPALTTPNEDQTHIQIVETR